MPAEIDFQPLSVVVVTVSDTRDLSTDTSGALAIELLQAVGHIVVKRLLIRDEQRQLTELLKVLAEDNKVQVVITTGGTGVTSRDVTLEAVTPLVSKWIVGFGELFRALSYQEIGASTIQSRSEAALCDQTLVFLLPGSPGAVRLAMEKIILPQLDIRTKPCNFVQLMPRL